MKTVPTTVRDDLARCWSLNPASLTYLGGGQDWSDGTLFNATRVGGDAEIVLKILDFPSHDRNAAIRAEDRIRFVRLFGDGGCRIVTPLPATSGNLVETRETGSTVYLAYTYRKVAGSPPTGVGPAATSGNLYRAVGSELGRMHAAWESRGPVVRADGTGTESQALSGWQGEMSFFRSWCQDDLVRGAWDRLRTAFGSLTVGPSTYGFVHNDAHLGNFLVESSTEAEPALTILDFDVANYHWYLNDCAVALYSFGIAAGGGIEAAQLPPAEGQARAATAFWEGYARHKDPTSLGLERLDWFLQYRRCLLFMPFQDQTAGQPDWRRRWVDRIVAADRRLFG